MPVNVSHGISPALMGQLGFKAGKGEYGKWKKQYEDQAEQQALSNAFKMSAEMRANQAPFTQAKLRNWSDQQRANIELDQTKALVNWRRSPEQVTLEAKNKYDVVKAQTEQADKLRSENNAKLQPNMAKDAVVVDSNGKVIMRGTEDGGILDSKAAQSAHDRTERQAAQIDSNSLPASMASRIERIPLGEDRQLVFDKKTGQLVAEGMTQRGQEKVDIRAAARESSKLWGVEHKKGTDKLLIESDKAIMKLGESKNMSALDILKLQRKNRNDIISDRNKVVPPAEEFLNMAADSMQLERISGGFGPQSGRAGWPGGEEGAKGWSPDPEGTSTPLPEVPKPPAVDAQGFDLTPVKDTHKQAEQKNAPKEVAALQTASSGLSKLISAVDELASEGEGEPSTNTLSKALTISQNVKGDLAFLKAFNAEGNGIIGGSALASTFTRLQSLDKKMKAGIEAAVNLVDTEAVYDRKGTHPQDVTGRIDKLGDTLSFIAKEMREAWVPMEHNIQRAISEMTPEELESASPFFARIFGSGAGVRQQVFGKTPEVPTRPEDRAQGATSSGMPTRTAMEKILRSGGQKPPVGATSLYNQPPSQTHALDKDHWYNFLNPFPVAARAGAELGASGEFNPGQVHDRADLQGWNAQAKAIEDGRVDPFPGGDRSVGKDTDWENVAGRNLRTGGRMLKYGAEGLWSSLFGI